MGKQEKTGIEIQGIRNDDWMNPFGATPEELVASALDTAGLLEPDTVINGKDGRLSYRRFCRKRDRFQQSMRIGSTLVRRDVITQDILRQAMTLQRQNQQPLVDILVDKYACPEGDIEAALKHEKHETEAKREQNEPRIPHVPWFEKYKK